MNSVGLIVYSTSDVAKAKDFFSTLLDVEPYADSARYTGFRTAEMEIGLVPHSPANGSTGALAYVSVGDIHAALEKLIAAGAQKLQDVTNVGGGMLIASIKDPDGTPIGLRQFPTN